MPGGVQRRHRHPGITGRDDENADAGVGFGRDQERVGDGAVADQRAGTREPAPVAARGGLYRSLAHLTVEGDRQDLLTAHRRHRPVLLQRVGAEFGQRAGAQHDGLQIRHGRELATQPDKHRHLLKRSETAAAQ